MQEDEEGGSTLKLTIKLFAGLADMMQTSEINIDLIPSSATIQQIKQMITERYPHCASIIAQSFVAKNQVYAHPEETVTEDDEIALIPPVSGGETVKQHTQHPTMYVISPEIIDIQEVSTKVMNPNHGAAILFIGTTREMTNGQRTILLEYDAYVPMAIRTLEQIGNELNEQWPGTRCAITHRIGSVGIGETSVVIAVSSPHRAKAYEASRYAIERLKQIVPIWKKEIWEDGSEWKGHQLGPWNPTISLKENEQHG